MKFWRNLRLIEPFTNYSTKNYSLVQTRNEYNLHSGRNENLYEFCKSIKDFYCRTIDKSKITSITKQWKYLTELQNNEDTTINKSGKQNSVVVIDKLYNKYLFISMLNESPHYEKNHKLHRKKDNEITSHPN